MVRVVVLHHMWKFPDCRPVGSWATSRAFDDASRRGTQTQADPRLLLGHRELSGNVGAWPSGL